MDRFTEKDVLSEDEYYEMKLLMIIFESMEFSISSIEHELKELANYEKCIADSKEALEHLEKISDIVNKARAKYYTKNKD